MANRQIQDFIRSLKLEGQLQRQQIVKLAHAVSQIPWGEARTVEDVLTQKIGTCTGKHLVLQACFNNLGIPYEPVVVTFKWSEQGLALPPELQKILNQGEWEHGHNFVQVTIDNKPVDLDITWDPPLKPYGFKTLPPDWNGETSFVGVNFIKRWDGVDMETMKKELIDGLSPDLQERRKQFLKGFINWINSFHNSSALASRTL